MQNQSLHMSGSGISSACGSGERDQLATAAIARERPADQQIAYCSHNTLKHALILCYDLRPLHAGRTLQQQQDPCPPGCKAGKCFVNAISGDLQCSLCDKGIALSNGRCGCLEGFYFGSNSSCPDSCCPCEVGFYCRGGELNSDADGLISGNRTACGVGLTTRGRRRWSLRQCGE